MDFLHMDGTAIFDIPTWGKPFNPYNVTQTDSMFVILQNLAQFWDCSKRPKSVISGNLSKMAMFEQLNDQLPLNSK